MFQIARFELGQRTWRLSSLVYFAAFFAVAFLAQISAGGAFANVTVGVGAGGKIFVNSPFQLHVLLTFLGYFGTIVTASVYGQSLCQDFETNSQALFFTSPVPERSYLAGRFLGAFGYLVLLHAALGLGVFVAGHTPFVQRSMFEPDHLSAYALPYLTTVLPNLVVLGGLFFCLAALTRKMMPVYVAGVVLFMGYLASGSLLTQIEYRGVAALVDPFGLTASGVLTEYTSVAEKNARLVPLAGVLLYNRLLWLGIAAALLGYTFVRFRYAEPQRRQKADAVEAEAPPVVLGRATLGVSSLAQVLRLARLNFSETVRQVHFIVIVLAAVLFTFVAVSQSGVIFGTNMYPVTYNVLDVVGGSFALFALLISIIYAGEMVWRERDARVDQLLDTMPTRTWVPFVGKLVALCLVQALLVSVVMACGLAYQIARGYFHFELGLYVQDLFGLRLVTFCLLGALALVVHTLVQQKYVGHLVLILYYVSLSFMSKLGLDHNLYKYVATPARRYSDMNHWGPFIGPVLWFDLYWALVATVLLLVASTFWVRGVASSGKTRLAIARARLTPALRVALAAAIVSAAGVGGFIYYNTNVLNHYESDNQHERDQADYEKRYKATAHEPQPRIVGVDVQLDLSPEKRSFHAQGTYRLVNKSGQPVTKVYVDIDDKTEVRSLRIDGHDPTTIDKHLGVYTIVLPTPLPPDAPATLTFDLFSAARGFRNEEQPTAIAGNGTFFTSESLVALGYLESAELADEGSRKKLGLPPKERMADVNDLAARRNTYIRSDSDWIDFAITVSTAPDQLAVAAGYLEREWMADGRSYFRYAMDHKILNFFSVLSARYAVKKDRWNDVALEIDYQPGHEYDLDAMMQGLKDSLAYYTTHFGPYPHRQARILEFPRYASFAQSFPNTIPFSESIGFIAKVDPNDPKDLDYPYYVTAHEMAHQWWAHQVIGGNVQGATMLSETLSQYSALMVMKKRVGATHMKRFLRYELDSYLEGRSVERKKEVPLYRVEDQQYIHYAKGSLVMYALQDYLGEELVDRVLSDYLAAVKYQEPPYTNSVELVERFRAAAPPELKYLVSDLFETITLYDNRATKATVTKVGARWRVTVDVKAKKLRASELGEEVEVPMDDLVDVGALDAKGDALFLEKKRIHAGDQQLTFELDHEPANVGIDPLNKLIDRVPDDNVVVPEH